MTKTLTEQWRKGKLERGCYFIKLYGETELVACYNDICDTFHTDIRTYTTSVKEVLAPVPSYDKVKEMVQKIHILNEQNTKQYNELCEEIKKNDRLEKKLDIATKALNKIYHDMKCWTFISKRDKRVLSVICEALQEMEGVK